MKKRRISITAVALALIPLLILGTVQLYNPKARCENFNFFPKTQVKTQKQRTQIATQKQPLRVVFEKKGDVFSTISANIVHKLDPIKTSKTLASSIKGLKTSKVEGSDGKPLLPLQYSLKKTSLVQGTPRVNLGYILLGFIGIQSFFAFVLYKVVKKAEQ